MPAELALVTPASGLPTVSLYDDFVDLNYLDTYNKNIKKSKIYKIYKNLEEPKPTFKDFFNNNHHNKVAICECGIIHNIKFYLRHMCSESHLIYEFRNEENNNINDEIIDEDEIYN